VSSAWSGTNSSNPPAARLADGSPEDGAGCDADAGGDDAGALALAPPLHAATMATMLNRLNTRFVDGNPVTSISSCR
jgi:hypothetical protein